MKDTKSEMSGSRHNLVFLNPFKWNDWDVPLCVKGNVRTSPHMCVSACVWQRAF